MKDVAVRRTLTIWALAGVPAVFVAFVVLVTVSADPNPPFAGIVGYWALALFVGLIASGTAAVAIVASGHRVLVAVIYPPFMTLVLCASAVIASVMAGDIH